MNSVVIVPSYNPDEKMPATVKQLIETGFNRIVVVDDGSKEECKKFFDQVKNYKEVTLLTHEVNKGKGRAMKTAFTYVYNNLPGVKGVVTVDGDGQHLPKDVLKCVNRMEEYGNKVILGVRDFSLPNVPKKSKFGNNLTKSIFKLLLGIKVSDTQTGLRAVPYLYLPVMIDIYGERYEYETNQLIIMKEKKIDVSEVVIDTVYLNDNETSHFHPIKDSARIYKIIFKYFFTTPLPKYLANSFVSFLIDILLFTVLNFAFVNAGMGAKTRVLLATVGARIVSSLFNFTVNRMLVFKSKEPLGKSMTKYYTLCACQAAVSFTLLYLVAEMLLGIHGGWLETLVKFCVDVCLMVASYLIQRKWVFKK